MNLTKLRAIIRLEKNRQARIRWLLRSKHLFITYQDIIIALEQAIPDALTSKKDAITLHQHLAIPDCTLIDDQYATDEYNKLIP